MPDDGGDDGGLAELRSQVAELKQTLQELKQASTPAEKREAREEVDEAEKDLSTAARKAGLDPARYRAAIQAAKLQAFEDEYGPIVDRRVDAALARLLAEEEDDEPAGEPKPKEPRPKEPKPKEPKEAAPKPDSGPVVPHWSERRVGELLK